MSNGKGMLIVHRREAKKILTSSIVIVLYEPNLSITLSRDGDSHMLPDSSEPKIVFASRTLSASVRNYAQIERKRFPWLLLFKWFHLYLYYGRRFPLITDHKPLLAILTPKRVFSPRQLPNFNAVLLLRTPTISNSSPQCPRQC